MKSLSRGRTGSNRYLVNSHFTVFCIRNTSFVHKYIIHWLLATMFINTFTSYTTQILSSCNPLLYIISRQFTLWFAVALAYSIQVVEEGAIPITPNDVPVDALVSPTGFIPISPIAKELRDSTVAFWETKYHVNFLFLFLNITVSITL